MGIGLALDISLLVILFVIFFVNNVLKRSIVTVDVQHISHAIKEGAKAFPARQYKTIETPAISAGALTFVIYYLK